MDHLPKIATDTALGAGGITYPIWVQWIEAGAHTFALVGGAALLVLRLAISVREWRKGKGRGKDDG